MDTKVDRITNLPECVASNILSRVPTIEAVRTCLLSRDWKYKWTCIYDIDINDGSHIDDSDECFSRELFNWETRVAWFRSFVDKVLDSNRDLSVRSVRFDLGAISHDSRNIGAWISKIVSLRVKNLLMVALNTQHNIVLPKILQCSTTLTELNLVVDCTLKVRILNCFPNLQSLYLSGGPDGIFRIINKQSPITGKLLFSFAALKYLELERVAFINAKLVEINVPELVYFKAYLAQNVDDYVVKLHASKLARFVMAQGPVCEFAQCILSLRDMDLSIGVENWEKSGPQVIALLNRAPNLKCLCLSWEFLPDHPTWDMVMACAIWEGVHIFPTLNQLKQLELSGASANVLPRFLHATPYLESLVLSTVYGFAQLQEPMPPCVVSQLKEVKFICFKKGWQTKLAKVFLENAKNLESVLFDLSYTNLTASSLIIALGPQHSSRIIVV